MRGGRPAGSGGTASRSRGSGARDRRVPAHPQRPLAAVARRRRAPRLPLRHHRHPADLADARGRRLARPADVRGRARLGRGRLGRRGAAGLRARRRRQRARPALPRRPGARPRDGRRHPLAGRLLARTARALAYTHTERNGTDFDLVVLDLATGERREVELEGWNVVAASQSTASCARGPTNVSHDLYLVDRGRRRAAPADRPRRPEQYLPARCCDDGTVCASATAARELQRLARLDPAVGSTFLTDDDADVEAIAVHGDRVRVRRNEDGHVAPDAGRPAVEALPDGVSAASRSRPTATRLALHVSPADGPTDVWVVADHIARVTRSTLGGVPRRPPAAAGAEIAHSLGWSADPLPAVRPRRRADRLPRARRPRVAGAAGANAVIQYLVGPGISVAVPNVRGSTGYGKTFGTSTTSSCGRRRARPGRRWRSTSAPSAACRSASWAARTVAT